MCRGHQITCKQAPAVPKHYCFHFHRSQSHLTHLLDSYSDREAVYSIFDQELLIGDLRWKSKI